MPENVVPDRHLLAVYDSADHAREAAGAARRAGAVAVRVADDDDHVYALETEMRDELEQGFILPHAGVALPEEAAKGVTLTVPIAAALGALLVAPVGFIPFGGPLGLRLLVAALIGAAMGATIAFIAAAGTAVRGRFEANAADRGVTVRVVPDTEAVEQALTTDGLIRLDRIRTDGAPDTTLETEADHDGTGVIEQMAGHVRAAPHVAGVNDESDPDYPHGDPSAPPSMESSSGADAQS